MFSTRLGSSANLKEALSDSILISNIGMVVSVDWPLIIPFILKLPLVSTLSKFLA